MEVAKIFENGRSQAVRLPKQFRFSGGEVFVQKLGGAVLLVPKEAAWQTLLNGLNSFTDDFFEDGRITFASMQSKTNPKKFLKNLKKICKKVCASLLLLWQN